MAIPRIKSTYALDVESVHALEDLARRWGVPKSEALRRAIWSEARRQSTGGALAALDQLQSSLRSRRVDLEQWALDVESERRAAGRRQDAAPR